MLHHKLNILPFLLFFALQDFELVKLKNIMMLDWLRFEQPMGLELLDEVCKGKYTPLQTALEQKDEVAFANKGIG